MTNEERILEMLARLEEKVDRIENDHGDRLKQLNGTVAKIEQEHGKKLGALYDAYIDTDRNLVDARSLRETVDDHSNRIFALEQARVVGGE